jgi:thiol-disulfide isomerase/thioredoxin
MTVAVLVLAGSGTALATASALAAGCSTGSGTSCPAPAAKGSGPGSMVGQPAPSTVGPNLTGTGTLDLAAVSGKPTAVVFWLNTCPHCQAALPAVNRLAAKLGPDRQIVTAAIDIGAKGSKGFETPAAAVKTLGLEMPTVLVTRDLADRWKVSSTPTAFVVDSGGTIRRVLVPSDPAQLAKDLGRALRQTG